MKKEWEKLVDYSEEIDVLLEYVTRFIDEQPKIGGWIPCSEWLPKKSKSYLVTKHFAGNEECAEAYETCSEIFWTQDNKWDCERDPDCEWKVIAWQPLPDAYIVKHGEGEANE